MKIAYFDCYSGISGDMTIAAFIDAGLNPATLKRELAKLKLKGYELKISRAKRGAISGTKFECITKDHSHNHRPLKDILKLIETSSLNKRVKEIANAIFTNIGTAEAKVHGIKRKDDIHLHELGDIDSIIDIIGTAIAIDELGIDQIYSSSITLGRTFVNSKHGTLPIPAPAVLELLKGAPVKISNIEAELVTPTGAGILKTLARTFGEMPQMNIDRTGYGAGTRDFSEMPNMLRVLIGERQPAFKEDRIFVIETNIDDMNPQNFEYLFEKLFKEGALDVYTTAIQMKKSRQAIKLTVMAEPSRLAAISSVIFSETTTIGVRFYEVNRFKLDRKFVKVRTGYGDVTVKVAGNSDSVFTIAPEYDECVKIARRKNVPLKAVYEEAKRAVKL